MRLNISDIIPEDIANFVDDEVQTLWPLETILSKITPANIQDCLTFGLVLMLTTAIVSSLLLGRLIAVANRILRLRICLVFKLLCSIPLLTHMIILLHIESKIQDLRSAIIRVKKGDVANQYVELSVALLLCW